MVGDVSGNNFVFHGFAHEFPILFCQLEGTLYGFATTGGEEHLVEIARCVVGQFVGKFDCCGVGVGPEWEESKFLCLTSSNFGKAGAPVTGVDHKQTREAVKISLALVVPDVMTIAFNNDGNVATIGEGALTGEVHPEVISGLVLKSLRLFATLCRRNPLGGCGFEGLL